MGSLSWTVLSLENPSIRTWERDWPRTDILAYTIMRCIIYQWFGGAIWGFNEVFWSRLLHQNQRVRTDTKERSLLSHLPLDCILTQYFKDNQIPWGIFSLKSLERLHHKCLCLSSYGWRRCNLMNRFSHLLCMTHCFTRRTHTGIPLIFGTDVEGDNDRLILITSALQCITLA